MLVIVFSYRFIQNTKMVYQNGWRVVPPFYGIFRAFFSIITVLVSYYYKENSTTNMLIFWIVAAIFSTFFAGYADVKGDWGFLNKTFLRKSLFFTDSVFVYYVIFILNIFLRLTWVMTLSPSIVNDFAILPYYFIMILAYL